MKVYFVGAGPGDPELLTVKARRLLETARLCIYAGSLVNPALLDLLPATAERHDSAAMNLDEIVALFEKARTRQIDVVRLHTGEPAIYGAIGEQMDALDRLGIAYEVVPGISAFQAAAAALRVELTAPEIAQTVILTRAPGRTPMPATEDLSRLAQSQATLCIFLSTDRLTELTAMLAEHYGADCPAALVYHASWPDEKFIRGTLADIGPRVAAEGITRTAIFLVGRALARPAAHVSKLYDKTFGHGYRPGSSAVKIAAISLSNEGARLAARLAAAWDTCDVFLHASVGWDERSEVPPTNFQRFDHIVDLSPEIFPAYEGLVYFAPIGAVVRAIAPCIQHKTVDPAVVVVDVGGRWAVSLLSGHEGGANELAVAVANILGAEPVITTTTEAVKNLIVGVGCRRGADAGTIVAAIREALTLVGGDLARVRLLASADIKADEPGLLQAARELGVPLHFIPADEIRHTARTFAHSELAQEKVDLPAVAEPAALLAGRRTQLLLPRQVLHGVTVAIARESCTSLE